MQLLISELAAFLIEAKTNTFASGAPRAASLRPRSKNYAYDKPPFRYEDQYFGEYVDVGEEVVWFHGIPIWGMGYRGGVVPEAFAVRVEAFDFLREALRNPSRQFPVRGPAFYRSERFSYVNQSRGNILAFTGEESVYLDDRQVCFRNYLGGLIHGKHSAEIEIANDLAAATSTQVNRPGFAGDSES